MAEDSGDSSRPSGETVRLFVPDDAHVWLSASVEGEYDQTKFGESAEHLNDRSVKVLIEDFANGAVIKEERMLEASDVSKLPLQNLDVPRGGVDNMTNLGYLHEASILHNLKKRFESHQPYTRTGQIVIAVNPYKWLDIYGQDSMNEYASKMWHELPSHVFATSAEAYRGMRDRGEKQSILVSGESGAGKTETVKIMLSMMATVASEAGSSPVEEGRVDEEKDNGEVDDDVVRKILLANPLLESFGNAKTTRNDNSSRFGKFMTLQFDSKSALIGSKCSTYLLEKSRVVMQNDPQERNYHIFYQLLSACEGVKERVLLRDRNASDFLYTANGDTRRNNSIEGVSDAQQYEATLSVLGLLNVNAPLCALMEEVLASVLHLGEVAFVPSREEEGATEVAGSAMNTCSLLGVSEHFFREQIVRRNIEVEGKTIKVGLSPEQSASTRDALAKEIYARLFQWLVIVINHTTSSTAATCSSTGEPAAISLLDIFGFESFAVNRFEQLCINLANEKLQQKFCNDCFRSVQQEYQDEGIELSKIDFQDNTDTLTVIEGCSRSVLAALNEECLLGKRGSDAGFLSKAKVFCASAAQFNVVLTRKSAFCISHYAGIVEYSSEGFLDKNRDTYPHEMQTILAGSSNALVATLFGPCGHYFSDADSAALLTSEVRAELLLLSNIGIGTSSSTTIKTGSSKIVEETGRSVIATATITTTIANGNSKKNPASRRSSFLSSETVTQKFRSQLGSLMETIERTDVQYVRCIKPNANRRSDEYDSRMVVHQLRSAGMIEAIRISRAAYPYRVTHSEFLARFKCLRGGAWHQARAKELQLHPQTQPRARGGLEDRVAIPALAPDRNQIRVITGALIADVLRKSPVPAPRSKRLSNGERDGTGEGGKYMARKRAMEKQERREEVAMTAATSVTGLEKDKNNEQEQEGKKSWELGRTRVYFSAGVLEHLETLRSSLLGANALLIQTSYRRHLFLAHYQRLRSSSVLVQACFRSYLGRCRYALVRACVIAIQQCGRRYLGRVQRAKLRQYRAVSIMQAHWRRRKHRLTFISLLRATVLLQAEIRGAQKRRRYAVLRDEARQQASLRGQVEAMRRRAEVEAEEKVRLQQQLDRRAREVEQELARVAAVAETEKVTARAEAQAHSQDLARRLQEAERELSLLRAQNNVLQAQVSTFKGSSRTQTHAPTQTERAASSSIPGLAVDDESHRPRSERVREEPAPPLPLPPPIAAAPQEWDIDARLALDADRESVIRAAQEEAAAILERAREQAASIFPAAAATGGTRKEKMETEPPVTRKSTSASADTLATRSAYSAEIAPLDRAHVTAMQAAMRNGTGVRCAVFAQDRKTNSMIGKPCLVKRHDDAAYAGHVRIDCEVVFAQTPAATQQTHKRGMSSPLPSPLKVLAIHPASSMSTVSAAADATTVGRVELPPFPVDTVMSASPDSSSSTPSSSSPSLRHVKTLRFGVGDIKKVTIGYKGSARGVESENGMKVLVLCVRDKGDLNFVLATEQAARRMKFVFEDMLRHPNARLTPSPKMTRRKSGDRGSTSSHTSSSTGSSAIVSPFKARTGTRTHSHTPLSRLVTTADPDLSPNPTTIINSSTAGLKAGVGMPSPPTLPYGTLRSTPVEKAKYGRPGAASGANDVVAQGQHMTPPLSPRAGDTAVEAFPPTTSAHPCKGPGRYTSPHDRFRTGWTFKDEGSRRLTRQFMVLDRLRASVRFTNTAYMPLSTISQEQGSPKHSPGQPGTVVDADDGAPDAHSGVRTYSEIGLHPDRMKVLKTSTTAFGNTVSMIELHDDKKGLITRLQFDKDEITAWFRALRDCLSR